MVDSECEDTSDESVKVNEDIRAFVDKLTGKTFDENSDGVSLDTLGDDGKTESELKETSNEENVL